MTRATHRRERLARELAVAGARGLATCALAAAIAAAALAGGALAVATLAAPAAASAAPAPVATSAASAPHPVIVVLAPFLTFGDLSPVRTPQLWRAMQLGTVGAMNARTADPGWPTVAGGALTLSASRWAIGPAGGPIDAASLDRARSANATSLAPPSLGALGTAVRAANGRAFSVGASDTDTSTAEGRRRYAELVATDASGALDGSAADVLLADLTAPFGLRTDLQRLDSALASALAPSPAAAGGSAETTRVLVVVDVGDLERAHDAPAAGDAYRAAHLRALGALDLAVGDALAAVQRDGALLLIVPIATDKDWYKQPYFGPLIVDGRGWHGEIVSASTRRNGLATNLDVAPTVLDAMGIATPQAMLGKPLGWHADGRDIAVRVAEYARVDTSIGAIDQLRDAWFLSWFCWTAIALTVLATGTALWSTRHRLPALAMFSEVTLVVLLSALPAAWLMFAIDAHPASVPEALRAFVVSTAAVAGVAFAVRSWFSRVRVAELLFLTSLATLVVVADQWLGHPIESGLFSYSTAAGWRFYGMGNEGAAIAVGASIAAVALLADALADKPSLAGAVRRFGLPIVGGVVLVTAAAPFAGANAGVAVWGLVAYAVAWAATNGVRLSWRSILLTLLGIIVLVGAFAAIDLARSSGGEGTHLARFAGGILHGDASDTAALVWRKLQNNINYLPQTPYTGLAIALALALAALHFAPSRPLRTATDSAPAYGVAVLGVLVGGLAAWATEDSGIVMPALMLLAGAAPLLVLALRAPRDT